MGGECLYRITDQIHKIIHRDIISKYNRGNVRLIKNFNSKTKKKKTREIQKELRLFITILVT